MADATILEPNRWTPPTTLGPAWSRPGLDIAAGRFPLAVERHILSMADVLVPGITTVTPHARYYALHGLAAAAATERGLDTDQADSLRRRAEVVMALVSRRHNHDETGAQLPRAHGADALNRTISDGKVDIAAAARHGVGGFVESARGFLNPYRASEIDLRILTDSANPEPGQDYDARAVRGALSEVIEMADAGTVDTGSFDSLGHLCVCAGARASDGAWLGRLLVAPDAPRRSRAGGRRETIEAFGRVLTMFDVTDPASDVATQLAFGDFAPNDPVVSALETAQAWRGALLRNYSIGSWRWLWRWLVDQVHGEGLLPAAALGEAFAAQVPDQTVAQFLADLPTTQLPSGEPAAAEQQLRGSDLSDPHRELAVLAVGALRTDQLSGRVKESFLGRAGGADLAPAWMARRLAAAQGQHLRAFAVDLTADLLGRAQRIAQQKARRQPDGTIWLPTRLHQRGHLVFATGREGGGDASLRLEQLTSVLAGAGLISCTDGLWKLTDRGRKLLDA